MCCQRVLGALLASDLAAADLHSSAYLLVVCLRMDKKEICWALFFFIANAF